ncbi:MAG: hypothetical protein GC145_11065 [Caulobacter sp.]|nr:hypothetical protein [Caulobacter sp.]
MIAHFAMPAANPRAVADVFARIIDGVAMPFPIVEGGWIVVARDGSGTGVEVIPETSAHHPGVGAYDPDFVSRQPGDEPWESQIRQDGAPQAASGFHVALTSALSIEEIIALGQSQGWRAIHAQRGPFFDLVELWVDNRIMIEVLPPEGTRRYLAFYTPDSVARAFAQPALTH